MMTILEINEHIDVLVTLKTSLDLTLDTLCAELERQQIEAAADAVIAAFERKDEMLAMELTKIPALAKEFSRQDLGTLRAFRRLEPEQKAEFERAFVRHAIACKRSGIPPEHLFIPELLADFRKGIHEPELMAA